MKTSSWADRFARPFGMNMGTGNPLNGFLCSHKVLLVFFGLLILSSLIEFSVFGPMLAVDNGMMIKLGDTATIIRNACDFAGDWSLPRLAKAYDMNGVPTEHILSSITLVTAAMVAIFGNYYPAYAGFDFLLQQVAFATVGACVFGISRSLTASIAIVILLATGAWLQRSIGINYTTFGHPMMMSLTLFSMYLAYRRGTGDKRNWQLVVLGLGTFFCCFILIAGVISVLIAGLTSLALSISRHRGSLSKFFASLDWPLYAVLTGVSLIMLAIYVYGIMVLGNPPPGSIDLEREAIAASPLVRLYTLMRMSSLSLLLPLIGGDGQLADYFWLPFAKDALRGSHILFLICFLFPFIVMAIGLRANREAGYRDTAVIIGVCLVMFLIACILSILGRGNIPYGTARYLIMPAILWACAFGFAIGLSLRWIGSRRIRAVSSVAVLLIAIGLGANQVRILTMLLEETKTLRVDFYKERPVLEWQGHCPLLRN